MKQNPFKNVGEIHKEWTAAGVSASRTTTHRRMQDMGFSCRIPCVKPLLNNRQRQKRLAWLRKTGLLSGPKLCSLMKVNFAFPLECHVICWCWSTVFSEVQGQHSVYQEVLEHFMLPAADQLYGDADFIFQQDLAPAHSAKATSTWFKDHGIPVLNWPANSPDLNPIENLWGIVKRKMRYARPNNAEELKATIRATWALITPEQCHRLIDSMPRRIAAVIQAKGAPTKY